MICFMARYRTPEQLAAHAAQSRERRRRQTTQRTGQGLDPSRRGRLLKLVRRGHHVGDVAADMGVSMVAVWERTRMLPEWGRELDEALLRGRDPKISHGSEWSHRVHRCRCPDCREAKRRYR